MANTLLGAVTSYVESDGHPQAHGRFTITEWYAQDTWRVARRLTLDAGLRFYYMMPTESAGDQVAQFEPDLWSAGSGASPVPAGEECGQPARGAEPADG